MARLKREKLCKVIIVFVPGSPCNWWAREGAESLKTRSSETASRVGGGKEAGQPPCALGCVDVHVPLS